MSEAIRKVKEHAARLLAKGKLGPAVEQYEKAVHLDPGDLTLRQKLGELYGRQGRTEDAIAVYQSVAGRYAADGHLLKAVAICKLILQLDPQHKETQSVLANLYARRRGDTVQVELPKAMSSAISLADDVSRPRSRAPTAEGMTTTPKASAKEIRGLSERELIERVTGRPRDAAVSTLLERMMTSSLAEATGKTLPAPVADSDEVFDRDLEAIDIEISHLDGAPVDDASAAHEAPIMELTDVFQIMPQDLPPIPLFSELPTEAFIALTERMVLRNALGGDVILVEGEVGQSMYVIIQGRVQVVRATPDGSLIPLAELNEGAFFGEMSLLSDAPRTASVVALDDTLLFEISQEVLAEVALQYPSIGEVMRRFYRNRLLANLLRTSPLFTSLTVPERKELIERFKCRWVEEGVVLASREQPADGLYVLLAGCCQALGLTPAGNDVVLGDLRDGDVFGELSMLWNRETCAAVRTVTPCIVLRLSRRRFDEAVQRFPILIEILERMAEARRHLHDELAGMKHFVVGGSMSDIVIL